MSFCQNEYLYVKCGISELIQIKNISLSKSSKSCPLGNGSILVCKNQSLIYGKVNSSCNGFSKCRIDFDSDEACFFDGKSLNIDYECKTSEVRSDPCKMISCGRGAFCQNLNEKAECTCPLGSNGDPTIRCCKPLICR